MPRWRGAVRKKSGIFEKSGIISHFFSYGREIDIQVAFRLRLVTKKDPDLFYHFLFQILLVSRPIEVMLFVASNLSVKRQFARPRFASVTISHRRGDLSKLR